MGCAVVSQVLEKCNDTYDKLFQQKTSHTYSIETLEYVLPMVFHTFLWGSQQFLAKLTLRAFSRPGYGLQY